MSRPRVILSLFFGELIRASFSLPLPLGYHVRTGRDPIIERQHDPTEAFGR